MDRLLWTTACLSLLLSLNPSRLHAETAVSQNGRISIDGSSFDFTPDEAIFAINDSLGLPEESDIDSRWQDNDISQIHITWDSDSVYVAGDGIINGNNIILLFDVGNPHPGVFAETGVSFSGLGTMTSLNSWRRNFTFDNGFFPDFFLATWDGNTTPRLLTATAANQVGEESPSTTGASGNFRAAATFQGTQADRSIEASLPWWKFLGFSSADGVERRFIPELNDTVSVLPDGVRLIRIAGVITAGGDGTGGPDSAPDNLQGHEVDSGIQVTIDNYAIIDLDAENAVTGDAGSDGIPDFGIEPRSRVRFLVRPPVMSLRFEVTDFHFSRPSFSPELGQDVSFEFSLSPKLDPQQAGLRSVVFSAAVYDMKGNLVKKLYDREDSGRNPPRPVGAPGSPTLDRWDGRDADGNMVAGGAYILRFVLEPDQVRLSRAVAVVR